MENGFIYLIKASGLIGVFYLAYTLLLRKETFFSGNRWFLLLGLITSSVLPLFFITKIIWVKPTPTNIDWSQIPVTTSTTIPEPETDWYAIAAYIYLTGIVILFLKLLFDFKSLFGLLKGKTIQQQGNFKLVDITENIAPFSYFNYIVYNSTLYSTAELENILEHEKVHSSQKHSVDVLISRLFCVFFWFNPLIWLYKKVIAQNLEFIADSEAAKKITDKKNYQLTLLKITTQENCVALTNHFYQSLIKKRIIMLNQNQSKKSNSWKYALIFPPLVAFVILFQIEVVAQEKETPKQETETVIINKKSDKSIVTGTSVKLNSNKDTILTDEKKPLIILDGHRNHKLKVEDIQNIDPNSIEQITVLKDKNAANKYGEEGKNGAIEITTKEKIGKNGFSTKGYKLKSHTKPNTKQDIQVIGFKTGSSSGNANQQKTVFDGEYLNREKILVIVDGKKSKTAVSDINPDSIESINVLKDKSAEDKYGEEGKNGVIEITTKEKILKNEFTTKGYKLKSDTKPNTKQEIQVIGFKAGSSSGNANQQKTVFNAKNIDHEKILVIVDGKKSKTAVKDLNPDSIESINVLKDKSAEDKYGEKGKNGVIEITTKSSKK
ncbi:M56 family metallopeptidase [Flavobacterium seoulense]|uniref:Peptidase M56 domain-containing protein n=1 Tax=Flavobacterium seoulense TaxID=1492738 RepID=A0A066WSH2_9FLAO|nr:M56 family metallopeptidase [Flavobacterium seoulense]KDN55533.1 hypothetical protein FEM21_14160 [Flavobacterium seoulense]